MGALRRTLHDSRFLGEDGEMTPCTGCGTALADNAVLFDTQARPVCQA